MCFRSKRGYFTIEDLIRMEGREPGGIDLRMEMEKFLKIKKKEPHLVGGDEVEYERDERELPEGWNPPGETKGVEVNKE